MGLLRSIVGGGAVVGGAVALGEVPLSPPPEPPLHATRNATRANDSDLATDWERTPPISLSLYLRAYPDKIPGCPLCGTGSVWNRKPKSDPKPSGLRSAS